MLISKVLHQGKDNSRLRKITIRGKEFFTPVYFASITTAALRTNFGPLIDVVFQLPYPNLLISTYDVYHSYNESDRKKIIDLLEEYSCEGNFVFADSGLFELSTFQKNDWTYDNYEQIIKNMKYDFFASYDVENPSKIEDGKLLSLTLENLKKSFSLSTDGQCISLCRTSNMDDTSNLIDDVIKNNVEYSSYVAITERDIGKSLIDNYKSIKKIRENVDKYNPNGLIHVLGCGDPISMAVMSYAGADSFDSVDWNRWLLDPITLEYENITHINIINCSCNACTANNMDDRERAWRHNLLFYHKFIGDLTYAIGNDIDLIDFLKEKKIDQNKITKMESIFNK